ncbi:MAG: EAL domain-containing protein [Methylotenera sp.]|uniref:EAL domain-containing protein n=1 Tax=Methylotenera sp. TaxID=2051956 RepID=UPI0024888644|nr:EAL domain-containing protein [Methylotenera sp.]MDI1310267.1 EAL domain-containing protein [Methylotenera sp.]
MAEPAKNEEARLARLRRLLVLDAAPEPLFDAITKLASDVCGTPISLISLIDESRQWFKANVGLEGATETHRDIAFCSHAILDNKILEIEDATKDARFSANPLVITDPNIRFYAGVPIVVGEDINIGTLCVIDREPKSLNEYQRMVLTGLAEIISKALVVREDGINVIHAKSKELAAIIEDSEDAIITKSLDGVVLTWNPSAEAIFGYTAKEIVGKSVTAIFPPDKVDEELFILKKIKNNEHIKHYETERRHKSGKLIQVSVSLSPIKNVMGEIIAVSKIARDITQQKQLEQALVIEHERLRVTMDSIGDAVITTDIKGNVQYINPIAQSLTGWSAVEAKGLPLQQIFNIVNEVTRARCENPLKLCLIENPIVGLVSNTILINRDGTEYGIDESASPIRGVDGKTVGVVLVFHDVTMQRLMAKEISYRATHDALTGLVNRSEFESRLKVIVSESRGASMQNALMYIDLDQFKVVNDTCGHSAGDALLKEVSRIMQSCIRSSDLLARIGGDEFAVILHKCDLEQAMVIAKKICRSIDELRFNYDEHRFRIGASLGLVMVDKNCTSETSLMQAADSACYEAKRAGRNRVHLYFNDDGLKGAHREDVQWVSRIEQALEDEGFVLFYQRILPLNHQGLEHAEILIRMKDTSGELIPPNAFLPAAERFHLITRIDSWVIAHTFEWMKQNAESLNHIETISVNLSGQSLGDSNFHNYVLSLIETIEIDCSKLCFEVTETVAITNIAAAKNFIESMNKHGVKFSLDDFGGGASSFGYLKNLDVDYLKIDGQFITDLIDNQIGQATVRCIVEVAKVTGKKTIAEWVENQAVENMLKEMSVDFTQGFLKHKPAGLHLLLEPKGA